MRENNVPENPGKKLTDFDFSFGLIVLVQAGILPTDALKLRLKQLEGGQGLRDGGVEEQKIDIQKLESASTEDL